MPTNELVPTRAAPVAPVKPTWDRDSVANAWPRKMTKYPTNPQIIATIVPAINALLNEFVLQQVNHAAFLILSFCQF